MKKSLGIILWSVILISIMRVDIGASEIASVIIEQEDTQETEFVWRQSDGKAYVCDENGNRVTDSGTPIIGGEKYYVDVNGYLRNGWLYLGNWKMYFDPITYTAKIGFAEINGKMYLFNNDGVMQNFAGTTIVNGGKYWFSDDDASLKTGWLNLGTWKLYFDPIDYKAKIGLAEIDGQKYIFDENGVMQGVPGTPLINGEKYWVSTEGYLKSGWLYLEDWKMYFDPLNYTAKRGLTVLDGKTYLFNTDGVMQNYAGTTVIDGQKYWFSDDDASLKTGWLDLCGMKLYFNPETYQAATGLVLIEDDYYYFNEDGVMYCGIEALYIGQYVYKFNADGKMISKDEAMRWPLPGYTYISSYFGYRNAPTIGASSYHKGIDIPAPAGTPILASKSGVVTAAEYNSTRGFYVTIDHENGCETIYMHMTSFIVSVGQQVSAEEVIGYVGTTGVSTGNHLHFSLVVDGINKDPLEYVTREE